MKASLEGAKAVSVHGRRPEAVDAICRLANQGNATVTGGDLIDEALTATAGACHLLISCLPLGMTGTGADDRTFDYLKALPQGALVVDLVYSPPRTRLLAEAEALGDPVRNGLPMLTLWGAYNVNGLKRMEGPLVTIAESIIDIYYSARTGIA